jgi:ABC-type multidrug transport system fused ATPase/permease subunit
MSGLLGLNLNPAINAAYRKELTADSLSLPAEAHTAEASRAFADFEKAWRSECNLAAVAFQKPSLVRALRRAFGCEFFKALLLKLVFSICLVLSASFFTRQLLDWLNKHRPDGDKTMGWLLSTFFFLCCVLQSIGYQQMLAKCSVLGLRLRAALSIAVYRKALVVDVHAAVAAKLPDALGLISGDASKVMEAAPALVNVLSSALETAGIVVALVVFLGSAALPGLGLIAVALPAQYYVGILGARLREKTVDAAGARVSRMEELLRAIKMVKAYAWTKASAKSVSEFRGKEVKVLAVSGLYKTLSLTLVFAIPVLVALLIFGVYINTSKLDSVVAFTTLSLFNTLRLPLVILPRCLRACSEGITALRRIHQYLVAAEVLPKSELLPRLNENLLAIDAPDKSTVISFENASFAYTLPEAFESKINNKPRPASVGAELKDSLLLGEAPSSADSLLATTSAAAGGQFHAILKHLNLTIKQGDLVAVVGPVSSGKSSLINALLGAMQLVGGKSRVAEGLRYAFCPQTAWTPAGTCKSAILFGKPFEQARFDEVVRICALTRDFEILEEGADTIVGERAVNLSGGQRARLAIARAAYSIDESDVYLFDSVLSALDNKTGRFIFNNLIKGTLSRRNKTVIMATHSLELLPQFDKVVIMKEGSAVYIGPPEKEALRAHLGELIVSTADTDVHLADAAESMVAAGATVAAGKGVASSAAAAAGSLPRALTSRTELIRKLEREGTFKASSSSSKDSSTASLVPSHEALRSLRSRSTLKILPLGALGALGLEEGKEYSSSRITGNEANLLFATEDPPTSPTTPSITNTTSKEATVSALRSLVGNAGISSADSSSSAFPLSVSSNHHNVNKSTSSIFPGGNDVDLLLPSGDATPAVVVAAPVPVAAAQAAAKSDKKEEGASGYGALFGEVGWFSLFFIMVIMVGTQLVRIFADIFVGSWSSNKYTMEQTWYLQWYLGYVLTFCVCLFVRGYSFYSFFRRAATRMHQKMFTSIVSAPLYFFTVTPLGKTLSCFSKDVDNLDESLPDALQMTLIYFMILLTTIGLIVRLLPAFAAVGFALSAAFWFFFRYYISASRVMKAANGDKLAALVASVSETLQGLHVIRAFGKESQFAQDNVQRLQGLQIATANLELLQVWLQVRLDAIACLMLGAVVWLVVGLAGDSDITASAAVLAISNGFQLLLFFSLMVRGAAEIDSSIASAERVHTLSQVQPEADKPVDANREAIVTYSPPPPSWPEKGGIVFKNVQMSYAAGLPAVLKGVSFSLPPAIKLGVVGRTGAGKSSLVMALFRLAELSGGSIEIDGVDTASLKLEDLRKSLAIVPQEPCLFQGDLRKNLDPFNQHTDEELVEACERCFLSDLLRAHGRASGAIDDASALKKGLEAPIAASGSNMSLGTAQLVCLARALLNPSKVLILDEASSQLDLETDAAVQRVITTAFADRTTVTIAHRLDTIITSDLILGMDAGRVAELDTPLNLLHKEDSIFAGLCRQSGASQYEALLLAAEQHARAVEALAKL